MSATDITEMDEHAGLIFQQIGSVVRYKNTWRIVYFLPMREIRTNLQAIVRKAIGMDSVKKLLIEQEVLNSVDLTNKAPSSISEIRPIFELMTTEIHEIARVLYDTGKLLFPEKKREKRSLLPIVGSLIDFLFGNIDEKTFSKLKQKLENVREKQGKMVDIMVNQTVMSRNMIKLVKEATEKVEKEVDNILASTRNLSKAIGEEEKGRTSSRNEYLTIISHLV